MLANKLEGAAASAVPVFVEDVFSTYLYTGNGSTQTITNGIDLSGKGGMTWFKCRSDAYDNFVHDSARGTQFGLSTNSTAVQAGGYDLTYLSNGFEQTNNYLGYNRNDLIYTSWTFRKQAKFFDVVTYTGNGSNRTIAHNLGSTPGCIIVKRTDTTSDWQVYHRSLTSAAYGIQLNLTNAEASDATLWNSTAPTGSVFSLGTDATVNANNGTYVAYLFAHDAGGFGASGSDNVISCGSVTTDGSGNATVSLGYEPQWVLYKQSNASGDDWKMLDVMRGWDLGTSDKMLFPNLTLAEAGGSKGNPEATGFSFKESSSSTYIYIAIRRGPMKTPTDATTIFTPTVYTGTNVDNRLVNTTIAPDMVWIRQRDSTTVAGMVVGDRLRAQPYLLTGSTAAEVNDADSFDAQLVSGTEYGTAFSSMSGVWVGNDATSQLNASTTASNQIAEAFKRAPGFFDVVCFTSNGSGGSGSQTHNLGATPELVIIKRRGASENWLVYANGLTSTNYQLNLNSNNAQTDRTYTWITLSSSAFTISDTELATSATYVAYLFASVSGVSKVGSYTGNGTTQTINCGFTAGARFILIKRRNATDDWYVFDSARGIVSGNDPFIRLNSTASENAANDDIDPDNSGFIVDEAGGRNLNTNNAIYIYLAIA